MGIFPDDVDAKFGRGIFNETLLPQLKNIVKDTIVSVKKSLKCSLGVKLCFNILSFDLIVDSNMKVWLVEANINPTTFHYKMWQKYNEMFIDEILSVTVDRIFKTSYRLDGLQLLEKIDL